MVTCTVYIELREPKSMVITLNGWDYYTFNGTFFSKKVYMHLQSTVHIPGQSAASSDSSQGTTPSLNGTKITAKLEQNLN